MPTTSPERGCSSPSTLQHQRCTEDATGGTSPSNPSSASQRLRTTLHSCTCCYSARCRFELGFEVNAAPGPCAALCSSLARSGRTAASRSVHRRVSEKNRHFFSDSDHLGVWNTPRTVISRSVFRALGARLGPPGLALFSVTYLEEVKA